LFETISGKLDDIFRRLKGQARLSEANIAEAMREVRMALLEADVNFKVARDFIKRVREKAVGADVLKSVTPAQQIVKIVHDELVELMGPADAAIPFAPSGPTVILMAGLQGSGKTTTCAKLGRLLRSKGKHPMLVAADVQRPAAIEQLKTLGRDEKLPVYSEQGVPVPTICANGVKHAVDNGLDFVIIDSAGRLHVDAEMMAEICKVAETVKPHQVYLVCDAMTGQDAVTSAGEFDAQLALDGVVLTKLDGDARGGAALSVRAVTGKPIKFVGVGEKLDALEEFHPDRTAGRILGMGDVVGLVEKAQEAMDEKKAQELEEKLLKNAFTLDDLLDQFASLRRMGSLKDLLGMIPGLGKHLGGAQVDEKQLARTEAIIRSMTASERARPETIDGSRRRRIAGGSGTAPQDVNALLKQFKQMRRMMKGMSKQPALAEAMFGGPSPRQAGSFRGKIRSKRKRKKRRR
jgi:signal recognition particle subunit SRP54